jgi:ParB family chromosome partitioning protein
MKESDEDFQALLRQNYGSEGTGVSPKGEVMRKPPSGPSKSLEALVGDNGASGDADAALPATPQTGTAIEINPEDVVHDIEVHLVVDSPFQPRKKYDESKLIALGHMLQDRGQDEPIIVRKLANGKYELIAGHRRIRAARLIGWGTIKARIRVLNDKEAEIATLVSNEAHEDLSDYERAKSYDRALKRGLAKNQTEVGRMFARTQARVSQCMSFLDLPAPVLELLDDYPGLISYRFVSVINSLAKEFPGSGDAIKKCLLGLIENPELTPSDLRAAVSRECRVKPAPKKKDKPLDVQDDDGNKIFQVKSDLAKNEIVIRVDPELGDFSASSKKIIAQLREIARKVKVQ